MRTLVTFLGRSQSQNPSGYATANYAFSDGNRTSTFFGLELTRTLKPDRVLILGTDASMWDNLVESFADAEGNCAPVPDDVLEARLSLIEAVKQNCVSQQILDKVLPILERRFQCQVLPRLIPYGRTRGEQQRILHTIAEAIPEGEVDFDVTHGFRHLSMVAFTSAFMLRHVRGISVNSLWYGALDMTRDGITPVLKLDGLNQVHRWTLALAQYEASGDYGVFADLLEQDGFPSSAARQLREAAYFERINNISEAAGKLRKAMKCLEQSLAGPAELFRPALLARFQWARTGELDAHQRHLAWEYLKRGDLPRAAVLAFEAVLTHHCFAVKLDCGNYKVREEAWRKLTGAIRRGDPVGHVGAFYRDLRKLQAIRNSIAHGLPAQNAEVQAFLENPGKLAAELHRVFQRVLGKPAGHWPW